MIETAGTSIAYLSAEDIDWTNERAYYSRRKLASRVGGRATLAMGEEIRKVLLSLPTTGPLFPRLRLLGENMRAGHFCKVCQQAGVSGVSLHSYRYAWAERACAAGIAQAHLGHGSRAIHRAYARNTEVGTLPLEHYERIKAAKLLPFTPSELQIASRCLT
jgi:integrase